jgi:hypothetical protein
MEMFVAENKSVLTEQVVASIAYAIEKNLSNVEVFRFQNTDYIVVLNVETFKDNLDNIYNYYITTEQYEFCNRVVELQQKLINHLNPNEQKKTTKRQQSKNSTKLKNKRHDTNYA